MAEAIKFTLDPKFKERLKGVEEEVLEKLGARWDSYAQDRVPVETGFLKSQLDHFVVEEGADVVLVAGVGDHVDYAIHVEERVHYIETSMVDALGEIEEFFPDA